MRRGFYSRFAWDSMRKNRRWYLPYMLACTLMQAMLYIVAALADNPGMNTMLGGNTLSMYLSFGVWVIAIFSAVFFKYTHGFLMRQRRSEFGLYHVLGMEKRHIARILAMESLLVAVGTLVVSLLLGLALNKLALLALVRLIGGEIPLGFHVSMSAIKMTVIIYGVIHLLLYVFAVLGLRKASAVELLKSSQNGEREPKARWLLAVLGVLTLAGGYFISIVTKDPLFAIFLFFAAVVLVVAGTYLLFIAGSTAWLKLMKKRKGYYYQTRHFINVSGMLYRMKQNAAGLASICILSTMVLVTVSATTSLYLGMRDNLSLLYPREYNLQLALDAPEFSGEAVLLQTASAVEEEVQRRGGAVENQILFQRFEYDSGGVDGALNVNDGPTRYAVCVAALEDYNAMTGIPVSLQAGQALLHVSGNGTFEAETVNVLGQDYKVMGSVDDEAARMLFMNNNVYTRVGVVVPTREDVQQLYTALRQVEKANRMDFRFHFDAPGMLRPADSDLELAVMEVLDADGFGETVPNYEFLMADFGNRSTDGQNYAAIFAGLFFAGIFLSAMFLMATILIIYYKQISEGLQDVRRFAIMRKVGLSDREIRKSIHSQVMTVFFLPLVTAGIHCVFAFPIISRMLSILAMNNTQGFIVCMALCFAIFAAIYVLVYSITARTYYKIVSSRGD